MTKTMASTEILSTASGLKSIKSAFTRSRRKSTASSSSAGSPPKLASSDPSAAAAASSLASKNYPHVHIKEMVYETCTRIPKHSYEESKNDCTCGKRVVERYREMCGLKNVECPGCKFGFENEEEESDDEYYY